MGSIEIRKLEAGHDGNRVVGPVTFSVEEGDYLVILGGNGSGKSTLLGTMLGLLKPLGGSVEYCGGWKRCDVGYLPQQTPVQKDFPASVMEVVLSGFVPVMGMRPFHTKGEKEEALRVLSLMGMSGMERRCYRSLSGGQQQRVLLSRAMVAARKVLVLDEPATALDEDARKKMYATLRRLNSEDGITIVMISHDRESVVEDATGIITLDGGFRMESAAEYRRRQNV